MRICYFGDYDAEYARNRILIRGLKENGVEIIECNSQCTGWSKYAELFKKHQKIKGSYDLMIVGYSDNRWIVPLARLLTGKKIIWDAFYSLYDSWVFDKKIVKPGSIKARYYWFLDWLSCRLANRVLLDTNEHIQYFEKTFKINHHKFIKVLIGADDELFHS